MMRFGSWIGAVVLAGLPVSTLAQDGSATLYPGITSCFQSITEPWAETGKTVFSCAQPALVRCLEGPEYGQCVAALTSGIEQFNAEMAGDFEDSGFLSQLLAARELCLDLPEDALAAQCSLSLALGHSGFLLERKLKVRK